MSRERGGMWSFEYEVAGAIDHTSLASGRASPEEEDDVVAAALIVSMMASVKVSQPRPDGSLPCRRGR